MADSPATLRDLLITATRTLRRRWHETLEPWHLSPHEHRALRVVGGSDGSPLRLGEVAKALRIVPRSATEVIDRLRWIASDLAPALRATLARTGGIELMPLMAQALNMGDEVHNRNAAATSLLFKRLAPAMFETSVPRAAAARAMGFIAGNDHFFLNLSMAACKAMLDAAANVPGSSMVVAMARNGVNFGIRLAGTGGQC